MTPPPDQKRRLPLLPRADVDEVDEDRPPWHWSAIGAVAVFVFWLPLILAVGAAVAGPGASWGSLHLASFVLASFGSGLLIGRFGGKAGRREAAVGGAAAGATAWLVAVTQGAPGGILVWLLLLALIAAVGGGAAFAGGALGLARRKR